MQVFSAKCDEIENCETGFHRSKSAAAEALANARLLAAAPDLLAALAEEDILEGN